MILSFLRRPSLICVTNQGYIFATARAIFTCNTLEASNYYQTLAISKNASPSEVKKAYYQLAKKHHPDKNPNDPKAAALFQEISEAYEVLGDEEKRSEYDNLFASTSTSYGYDFKSSGLGKKNTAHKANQNWSYQAQSDPLELFRKVFGDFASNISHTVEDHSSFAQNRLPRAYISLTLEEAAVGVSKAVKFFNSPSFTR